MARYLFDTSFEQRLIDVCRTADSMAKAAVILGMNYKTLCFHAKRLGCFKPNQPGKGLSKEPSKIPIAIARIFDGTHTTYQTHKLKKRLLKEGYKQAQCELCGLSEWMGRQIPLELHHRNGVNIDNSLDNLELLCPNCHALTDNYRAKNIKKLSARMETSAVEPLKFGETLL
ncbi:HNH endonuclease signature motif containing protein [Spirosoma sp. KUDC1026]|uniref:HNH endonuclease signature motif containing protein n=1 Tax=Spirosoma sp. KUDC1026 TaxID=2745947 RepID=UPI00159BD5D1|nr:HNH endonuclease signature motif containing protein [Spirosoma sp. KUDC1026]QKZ15471.1 HNH endonuclease [Spirosoma sp. KUDC1026]